MKLTVTLILLRKVNLKPAEGTVQVRVARVAERMLLRTWWESHDEGGFFEQLVEDPLLALYTAFQHGPSNALLAGVAQLDLTAPFGFQDLRGGDAAGGIRVED